MKVKIKRSEHPHQPEIMKKDEAQNLNGESKPLQDYKEAVCKLNENMVHDLRSPLTIITLQAELMKVEGSLSARAIEMCLRIVESGKKIDAILGDYLAASSSIEL